MNEANTERNWNEKWPERAPVGFVLHTHRCPHPCLPVAFPAFQKKFPFRPKVWMNSMTKIFHEKGSKYPSVC